LAHTSWFFETFVLAPLGLRPFHAMYAMLFNSYYQSVGPQHSRAQRGLLSRPTLAEVYRYRVHVESGVRRAFDDLDPEGLTLLELGLNHEQQHQELLLTDLKHALFQNPLRPAYHPAPSRPDRFSPAMRWLRFDEG